jgi:AcrR family transcriptional regulator
MAIDLPQIDSEHAERADAARNRRKVLEAASRLFECHGAANVSMDQVAAEAGVGKGTLFRRFGDRASLARSVLGANETTLQEQLIRGAAPLGPGAPPLERLIAFGRAFIDFLELHRDLLLAAEIGTATGRYTSAPYAFYRTHVRLLLEQSGVDGPLDFLADVLLAPLSAAAYCYQRDVRELSADELKRAYEDLIERIAGAS